MRLSVMVKSYLNVEVESNVAYEVQSELLGAYETTPQEEPIKLNIKMNVNCHVG